VKGHHASYYLRASSQTGDGRTIVIDEADIRGSSGYVAIHADGDGAPGTTIGVSKLLPPGVSKHVKVLLSRRLPRSGVVFPMLHLEDNRNKTYDFPEGDAPATADAQIVVVPITITLEK